MQNSEELLAAPAVEDIYPTRGQQTPGISPRKDPVVYSEQLPIANPVATAGLINSYRENGFMVLHDVFTGEEINCFQQELNRLRNSRQLQDADETISEPGSGEIRSVFSVHRLSKVFRKLISDQRLAGLASYLLDDSVYIHQSRVNYKPGFRGKEFYWHSDFETWHAEDGMPRMRALSISISLTENYTYNGPLMLIPGSQNDFVACGGDTPEDNYKASLKKQEIGVPDDQSLTTLAEKGGIETATGTAGSVTVFDCNVMHGSSGNISPFPRSNIFLVYNAISNRVVDPFCGQAPRPEFICARKYVEVIKPTSYSAGDYGN